MAPTSERRARSWSDFACLAVEQFKHQLTALIGFPFIIATLLVAWHYIRPDLQAIAAIVSENAQITTHQAEITRDQAQVTKALAEAQKQQAEMLLELRQLLKDAKSKS